MIAAKNKIKNNNKGKPENIQKNVNKNALESTSEKTPNPIKEKKVIPLKQKSKPTPTGNRSMFDFVKKK